MRLGSHVRGAIGEERQAAALVAVLVGVFIATAALALQSWRDDRARRTEAEDALRRTGAYAMVAYRTRIEGALWNALVALFRPVGGRLGRTGDPPPLASLSESFSAVEQCRCLPVLAPRYLFRLDLRTGALEISGTGADSALRSWLAAWPHQRESAMLAMASQSPQSGTKPQTRAQGRISAAHTANRV